MTETNFIRRLYPTTKLYLCLLIALSSVIIPSSIYAFSCFLIAAVIAAMAGNLKDYLRFSRKSILILVILIMVMQFLFYPGTDEVWRKGIFRITREGIDYGFTMSSRVLAIACSFVLFFRITEVKDFVLALEQNGFSPTATYIILATLQMIPEMKKQSAVIMDAQRARGVETEGSVLKRIKAFVPMLGPLVLSSIANTEERAITLESRAFTAPLKKTRIHRIEVTAADKPLKIVLLVVLIAIIAGRIVLWLI